VSSDLEREIELGSNDSEVHEAEVEFNDKEFEIMKHLDEEFRDHFSQSEGFQGKSTAEDEKYQAFLEQSIRSEASLYEHLLAQAQETFDSEQDRAVAAALIGNLNERGFIETPLEEIAAWHGFEVSELERVLELIQSFEPYGVGARSLQESLLIQLRCLQKRHTLAYAIIESHFEDLLNNRVPVIQKGLDCTATEVREAIEKHIAKLDLHPGVWHAQHRVQNIVPDVTIDDGPEGLSVRLDRERIPRFGISSRYLRMLEDETIPLETKEYLRQKIQSGKWLLKNIDQRNDTVFRIAEYLVEHQAEFLGRSDGQLRPLTMKAVAEQLELHESTIARTVNGKYVDCPRGLLPLRSFFTNAYTSTEGSAVSSSSVKDLVRDIIGQEDKAKPLSDDAISNLIKQRGIKCARRTVAKYRKELSIGNTSQRRRYD
jgi:RNA polymerase sigma-54 factor